MIDFKRYEPQLLSGGQKQRVAIASNLALGLSVIIFDESTSMLDPKGKEEINKLITQLRKENPEIVIIQITHAMDEVLFGDRVIALDKGSIYFDGKPDDFFKNAAVLEYLNIKPPFKYALFNHLKKQNVDININDSYEKVRDKIYEH
jgi:energy-coupling factor transport system ATP-binding protein